MKKHVVKSGWTAKGILFYNECYHAITENRKEYGADFDKAFMHHITNNASCGSNKQKTQNNCFHKQKTICECHVCACTVLWFVVKIKTF